MADVNKKLSDNDYMEYALVANVPSFYHASDLRNYFSQFVEQGGFDCFHFRHRPEIVKRNNDCDGPERVVDDETCNKQSVTGRVGRSDSNKKTTCCVIRLRYSKYEELSRTYNRKCWLDRKGESVKSICCISRIKVADVTSDGTQFKTRGEERKIDGDRQVFTSKDLHGLPELHPPALMPNGNVGTPTSYFLKQIQLCRLPSSIIAKLGLVFPRTRSNKKYGCVPFTYHGTAVKEGSTNEFASVTSSKGHEILSEKEAALFESQRVKETITEDKDKNDNAESESDADDCEEWERHEAFHDDPSNQDRNTERLYESQMEIVWEKGGPGIVWYTDAQFWDELSGNEEEKDVDEWDIDMGVYYERDDGDKDARDMMTMRRDVRRREGLHDSQKNIGKFEKHTKGIGRKLMTKYGWKEGQGLGSSITGIVDALDDEGGQKPYDKRGIGYRGEKLNFFSGQLTQKRPHTETSSSAVKISTVYDDPAITDPTERLLRRNEPTRMKHRVKQLRASSSN